MRATTTEGREIDLNKDSFDALKGRLWGPMFFPGDAGYDESRLVWNAMIDRKPAAIVRCLGTADVMACVCSLREKTTSCSVSRVGDTISQGLLRRTGR